MDWVHCNKCFGQLENGITLHLTSCGHMFCNICLEKGFRESKCILCRASCSVTKLVPDMNQEIQDYFTEPEEIIKKSCEVMSFQNQHRRRLLSYLLQSTKKFYKLRTELKRVTEFCHKQNRELKEYRNVISGLEAQLAGRKVSPFNIPISPGSNISPSFIQGTAMYKTPARSTPYNQQPYQSNFVTPTRITKQRSNMIMSAHSQRSNTSNKISSTVFTPPEPVSSGFHLSQYSNESGYLSNSPVVQNSQNVLYCNGFDPKCNFKNNMKIMKSRYV